ncbi:glycosyltransferase [Okeanomitos corallinicola TIOX110]|uniref:Glycosyltransferase n=1 Tax=Okeanomitos corallinicola TIOX110 TaxID=3133117 RepID=A0ABZ2UXI3_9CYAN
MKHPLISIITPAYKAENTIIRAVKSVIKQDFPDWEMIIISDDLQNYEQILKENNIIDARLQFTSTNKLGSGASNARNKGLETAKGQYIASLDADDEFKSQKLSKMIPLVEKYGAAVSDIEFRDSDSYLALEKLNQLPENDFLSAKDIIPVCLHTYSIYLYDRAKIPNLYYENDLARAQDLVFLMSFFNHIEFIGFESDRLHTYYRREGSVCNSADTHATSHQNKQRLLAKINNDQISIQNELAKEETRKYMNFSLEIDDIYDQEILKNPQAEWLQIFKTQIQERYFLS